MNETFLNPHTLFRSLKSISLLPVSLSFNKSLLMKALKLSLRIVCEKNKAKHRSISDLAAYFIKSRWVPGFGGWPNKLCEINSFV